MSHHLIWAATLLAATALSAQEHNAPSKPVNRARQELLDPFLGAAHEALDLAKAVPEDKYSWRPMEGVRSFGEVFAHMAGSTLLFCSYAGMQPPPGPAHDLATIYMKRGFEMPEIFASERTLKTKAQVIAAMEQAFREARGLFERLSDTEMEKTTDFFGSTLTMRGLLVRMGDHLSEHLGQSIAYARVNHIVPPWSRPKQ
jgi:hypothetical protein